VDSGTRRNIVTYYLNFVVVAAVGFIVNPLLLGALGPVLFGIWKSLQRYLDFATVADGRASQALKWIVASRSTLSDQERRRDIGAAIIVWFYWLPAAALVAAGVTLAVPLLIRGIPEDARSVAFAAAAILAANTVLAGLLALPDSVLTGVNQGYKSMLITTLVFIISNAAMIVAAISGGPLWSLAVIILIAAILNAALTLMVAKRAVPWWGISRPTRHDVRRVLGYSSWTLGSMLVDKLFVACELVVISVMVGAVAVTQYTFTTYLMQFVLTIAMVTASGFMPKLGAHLGASELNEAAEMASSLRHLVVGVAVLGGSTVLAFNGAIVALWVGTDQYLGTTLNTLFVVCGLQFAFIRMDGQILDVTMRIATKVLVGLLSSAGGIAAGCISFALTHDLDVALVAVITLRLISNVVYPVLVARSIPDSAVRWRPMLIAGALLIVSFGIGPLVETGQLLVKTGLGVAWVLLAGAAAWFGLVPRTTVQAILSRGEPTSPGGAHRKE
jgi:O-antigen/teichoic acid export membrane protein